MELNTPSSFIGSDAVITINNVSGTMMGEQVAYESFPAPPPMSTTNYDKKEKSLNRWENIWNWE